MSKLKPPKTLPQINARRQIARSRFFCIEEVDLAFSNGETRTFERMAGSGRGAVMIIPLVDDEHFLLIREYAAGTHSYQLGFPKGLIDPNETPETAANRELQEEVGYAAKKLSMLKTVQMAPTFYDASMHIFVAEGLHPSSLIGDEPEPLEVIKWPINQSTELLDNDDFREARSVAALLLLQRWRKSL
ncbi:ADP compounds hydrolase NudE [Agaribacter flavus]|uniref:ADP compounds hydrolase NudE n=1 Tax=Agaribacter flavus TaxID=1902781 RepID=A0ABV7FTB0_9ALTE